MWPLLRQYELKKLTCLHIAYGSKVSNPKNLTILKMINIYQLCLKVGFFARNTDDSVVRVTLGKESNLNGSETKSNHRDVR